MKTYAFPVLKSQNSIFRMPNCVLIWKICNVFTEFWSRCIIFHFFHQKINIFSLKSTGNCQCSLLSNWWYLISVLTWTISTWENKVSTICLLYRIVPKNTSAFPLSIPLNIIIRLKALYSHFFGYMGQKCKVHCTL